MEGPLFHEILFFSYLFFYKEFMNFVPEVFSYLLTASLSLPEDIGVLWAGENDGTEVAPLHRVLLG